MRRDKLPLVPVPIVYACSGCSGAAQLANDVAVALDRGDVAEMSCIVGVGGDVPSLTKLARSGRPIVALDGCPLDCVRMVLARHQIVPIEHIRMSDHGCDKRRHGSYGDADVQRELAQVTERIGSLARARQTNLEARTTELRFDDAHLAAVLTDDLGHDR